MRLRSIVLIALTGVVVGPARPAAPLAQGLTAPPIWTGSIRCTIDMKGPGYSYHQTHTWTLTGAVAADGGVLDYPATWTVSGAGSSLPTPTNRASSTWKTQGSASGVRMAIFVRQSDQRLLVFLRHSQLSAANGTTGTVERTDAVTPRARLQTISSPAFEWRPFPTIQDAPTSTHITGSSVTAITERLDATQPPGTQGQAACTWDLVQGAVATGTSTAQTARPPVLQPAGRTAPIAPPPGTSTDTLRRERPPLSAEVQKGLADAAARAEAEAAATSCKPTPPDPCVTIAGPTQVTAGATGTFTLQFSNISTATTTTTYPNSSSSTATPAVQLDFTFTVDGGNQQRVTKSIAAGSSGPITMTWTFTSQNAGAHTVKATGSVIRIITTTTNVPVYDSNGNRIGTNQNQTYTTMTNTMAVQRVVNVTP